MKKYSGVAAVIIVVAVAFSGTALARESPLIFGAEIPIVIPVSNLSDVASVGMGVLLDVGYEVSESLVPKLSLGIIHHFEKNTVSSNIVPVWLGVDYSFGKGHLEPVVGADLGLNYMMWSSSANSAYSSSEAKFGFDVNGGVKYMLGKKLQVFGKLAFGTYSLGAFGDTLFVGIFLGGNYDL